MATIDAGREGVKVRQEEPGKAIMSGFEGSAANAGALAQHGGALSSVAREEAEIKAAIVLARSSPRDELAAYNRIIKSCQRPTFAEGARYCFPRGDSKITGPSVQMAREAARCWGNIRYGLRVVTEDDKSMHIKGYAYDLETNNYVEAEDKFKKLIQRKSREGTRWIEPDERDLRELINRRGAFCVRNALLQLLPPDVIEDALDAAVETMRAAANGELKQDRGAAIRRLVLAFDELQVTTEMLAAYLGHSLDLVTDQEMVDLRSVYKSIRDGQSVRGDHFAVPAGPGAEATVPASAGAQGLADRLNATKPEQPPEDKPTQSGADFLASMGDMPKEPPVGTTGHGKKK
jgi:hypothetical protein